MPGAGASLELLPVREPVIQRHAALIFNLVRQPADSASPHSTEVALQINRPSMADKNEACGSDPPLDYDHQARMIREASLEAKHKSKAYILNSTGTMQNLVFS